MSKKKDRFGSIGMPRGASSTAQYQMGAVQMRSSSPWRRNVARGIVAAALIITLSCVIILINHSNRAIKNSERAQQQLTESYNPSFKVRYGDLGRQVISSWYAKESPPVDLAKGVEWPEESESKSNDENAEDESILVTGIALMDGKRTNLVMDNKTSEIKSFDEVLTYRAFLEDEPVAITVNLHSALGEEDPYPVLMATPSLEPLDETVDREISSEPEDLDKVDLTEETTQQITTWAQAWASDDRRSLKQIVADPDPKRLYSGLGKGWSVPEDEEPTVNWQRQKSMDGEKYIVASVSFNIVKSLDTGEVDEDKNPIYRELSNLQTMDILIGDYESGIPTVVAWGDSGTWDELKPRQNSYVNSEDEESRIPEEEEPTEMPTDAATDSPASPEPSENEKPADKKKGD